MAEASARNRRQQKLTSLGLTWPLWLFEADDCRWPRRLDSLLPTARPAKISGWLLGHWEYGQELTPVQDLKDADGTKHLPIDRVRRGELAHKALTQLRYDDTYSADKLSVVCESGSGDGAEQHVALTSWLEDAGPRRFDPSRVLRIERTWDRVPLWDPMRGMLHLGDGRVDDVVYGIATLVANDEELVRASGVLSTDEGNGIRRAEFALMDGNEESVQGVLWSARWREPGDHGLMLHQGARAKCNTQLLAGTILQNAPWEDVVEYRNRKRSGPLFA